MVAMESSSKASTEKALDPAVMKDDGFAKDGFSDDNSLVQNNSGKVADGAVDPASESPVGTDAGSVLHELAVRTTLVLEDAVELAKSASLPGGSDEGATAQDENRDDQIEASSSKGGDPQTMGDQAQTSDRNKGDIQNAGCNNEENAGMARTTQLPASLNSGHEESSPKPESPFSAGAIAALIRERLSASVSACVTLDMSSISCNTGEDATKDVSDECVLGTSRTIQTTLSGASSIFPLRSFPSNLLDMEAQGDTEEEMAQEIEDRKIITANVLGAHVLEGLLKDVVTDGDASCLKCGMPLAVAGQNGSDQLNCVVCPELVRKSIEEAQIAQEEERQKEMTRLFEAARAEEAEAEAARKCKELEEQRKTMKEVKKKQEENEAKKRREEAERQAEEARIAEVERQAAEALKVKEARRKEEEIRAEEKRRAEEQQRAKQARKVEDAQRAEERRIQREEEARRYAETHLTEWTRQADELMVASSQSYDVEKREFDVGMEIGLEGENDKNIAAEVEPSKAKQDCDDWVGRREQARSTMIQKMRGGWSMVPDCCEGAECEFSPLLHHGESGAKVCVVCGGSGSGSDGLYAADAERSECLEPQLSKDEAESCTEN